MDELLICEDCGAAVERDASSYSADCPDCGRRYHSRMGCC